MPARGEVQVVQKKHPIKPAGVAGRRVRAPGAEPRRAAGWRSSAYVPCNPSLSPQDCVQARSLPRMQAGVPCSLTPW